MKIPAWKDDNKSKSKIIESLTTCQRRYTIVNNEKYMQNLIHIRTHKRETTGNK